MKPRKLQYAVVAFAILAGVALAVHLSMDDETPPPGPNLVSWKSFDEGSALARQSNKKLIVDVYTDWCGWCKKMDSDVYSDQKVIGAVNNNFIAVKLNAESSKQITFRGRTIAESELAKELGVTGYPTTVFFDAEGNAITAIPGYFPADKFVDLVGYIGHDSYKSVTYQDYLSRTTPSR